MLFSLFATEDTLIGGGIVGGVMSFALGVYVIWDKVKSRHEAGAVAAAAVKAVQQQNASAARQNEITVEALASQKVAEVWERFAEERKAAHERDLRERREAHERDVKQLTEMIERTRARIAELEAHKIYCDKVTDELKVQNGEQARVMESQAAEMRSLRAYLAKLERQLKRIAPESDPSGPHVPLE